MKRLLVALGWMVLVAQGQVHAQPPAPSPVRVFAAGSLREALSAVARAFESTGGGKVELVFGPSGLLRERLAGGEKADLFASANTEHPLALVQSGHAVDMRPFTRNRLCGLLRGGFTVASDGLLEALLDPRTRLATSTPGSDPAGDYVWLLFGRADALRPGAREQLSRKALQLVGGPRSAPTPPGRSAYAHWMAEGAADVFLTYCTNAVIARRELPALGIVEAPESLGVEATYGVALMRGASFAGVALRDFLLAPAAQEILVDQGFARMRP